MGNVRPRSDIRSRARLALLAAAWATVAAAAEAPSGPLRIAVVAGNDAAGAGLRPLRYAQRDAERIHEILTRLGGFSAADTTLLLGKSADAFLSALSTAERAAADAARRGQKSVLVVYYSGHAKDGALRMGPSQLPLATLRERLASSSADVKVALLDSCRSGELTRTKGAKRGAEFSVDLVDTATPKGLAILTSSSGDEDSQESDLLAASFFTHFLASGLLGDADVSGDGRVTLNEAYSYAYERTVGETASTRAGPQHPTYAYDLAGSGELWMTDLGGARGALVFPAALAGNYFVVDGRRRAVVAEIAKSAGTERRIALAPGEYEVKRREGDHVLLARLRVGEGAETRLDERDMQRVKVTDDVAKGADPGLMPLLVRPSRISLAAWLGVQGFLSAPVRDGFFPAMPLVGLELELRDLIRPDMFLAFDVAMGGVEHAFTLDGVATATQVSEITGGAALAYEWDLGTLQPFLGVRFSSILVGRKFPGGELPDQALLTMSPGLVGGTSIGLTDSLYFGLRGRLSYLVYNLDGNQSVGYGDVSGSVRWEF